MWALCCAHICLFIFIVHFLNQVSKEESYFWVLNDARPRLSSTPSLALSSEKDAKMS